MRGVQAAVHDTLHAQLRYLAWCLADRWIYCSPGRSGSGYAFVRAVFAVAVMFIAGLMAISDPETAGAHPPESKPNVSATGQAGEPSEKEPAVSEADWQVGYFQFESLSWLASRCPAPLQRETIQQALAELQTATQLPQTPSLKDTCNAVDDRKGLRGRSQRILFLRPLPLVVTFGNRFLWGFRRTFSLNLRV